MITEVYGVCFSVMYPMKILLHRGQKLVLLHCLCHRACELWCFHARYEFGCKRWRRPLACSSWTPPIFLSSAVLPRHVSSACNIARNGTCCSKPFYVIVNCCPVWKRRQERSLRRYFVIGTVFSVCNI